MNTETSRKTAAINIIDAAEVCLRQLAHLERCTPGLSENSTTTTLRANLLDLIAIAEGSPSSNWPDAAAHFAGAYTENRRQSDVTAARS